MPSDGHHRSGRCDRRRRHRPHLLRMLTWPIHWCGCKRLGAIHVSVTTEKTSGSRQAQLLSSGAATGMRQLFGTDGIRGVAGEYPLDQPHSLRNWARPGPATGCARYREARVLIGQDTRESSAWISSVLAAGLEAANVDVVSAGVITTPGIAYLTRKNRFAAGIVISASHNPWNDNGIKIFGADGYKLSDELEHDIEADIFAHSNNWRRAPPTRGTRFRHAAGRAKFAGTIRRVACRLRCRDRLQPAARAGGLRQRRGQHHRSPGVSRIAESPPTSCTSSPMDAISMPAAARCIPSTWRRPSQPPRANTILALPSTATPTALSSPTMQDM